MKKLILMYFFSFTVGSNVEANYKPSLIEKIHAQIYYTENMSFDEPERVEYWHGQHDAFVMVFNELALEYRDHH